MSELGTFMFGDSVGPWHIWFAWRPVKTIDGRWTWLRTIERQRYALKPHLPGPMTEWWGYRRHDGIVSSPLNRG